MGAGRQTMILILPVFVRSWKQTQSKSPYSPFVTKVPVTLSGVCPPGDRHLFRQFVPQDGILQPGHRPGLLFVPGTLNRSDNPPNMTNPLTKITASINIKPYG
jgi:hypothetical protein